MEKISVLFVCMGNICRSPTAHGVFRHLVEQAGLSSEIFIDSAGTYAYYQGEPPDQRAQDVARRHGIDMSDLAARKVVAEDFENFDYILAMDTENYQDLKKRCPEQYQAKVEYFLDYAPDVKEREVPDPYYGGKQGFERVFNLVEVASEGLLTRIKKSFHFRCPTEYDRQQAQRS